MPTAMIVRVSAPIATAIAARARKAGWSFADECHRILEASCGLHQGEGIIQAGQVALPMRCWRYRALKPSQLRIRSTIDRELAAAAHEHRWPVSAEVNTRLQAFLDAQPSEMVA